MQKIYSFAYISFLHTFLHIIQNTDLYDIQNTQTFTLYYK